MVDGERRATARPLRPAAPPDDGARSIPRQRSDRDSLPPESPADRQPAADPGTATGPDAGPGAGAGTTPDPTPAAGA
ncbi:murein transglycosylase, partial [Micromonospora sp. NPDC005313]